MAFQKKVVEQPVKEQTPEEVVAKAAEGVGLSQDALMAFMLQMAETQKAIAGAIQQNATPKQEILPDREEAINKLLIKVDQNRIGKNLVYKIVGDAYKRHLHLQSRTLIYKDGKQFQLRYVKNYDTPFVEQQEGEVEIGNVDFENQLISLSDDICLFRFLQLHPDNIENGGKLFKLVNKKADAEAELEMYEITDNAKDWVKSLGEKEMKAVAKYLTDISIDAINMLTKPQLKLVLMKECDARPKKVLEVKDDPRVQTSYLYHLAIASGLLSFNSDSGKLKNKNSGREIVVIPAGEDAGLWIAAWSIRDEKGREFIEYLKKNL